MRGRPLDFGVTSALPTSLHGALGRIIAANNRLPEKLRAIWGGVHTIDEDVNHLTRVELILDETSGRSYLLQSYLDGMQVIEVSKLYRRQMPASLIWTTGTSSSSSPPRSPTSSAFPTEVDQRPAAGSGGSLRHGRCTPSERPTASRKKSRGDENANSLTEPLHQGNDDDRLLLPPPLTQPPPTETPALSSQLPAPSQAPSHPPSNAPSGKGPPNPQDTPLESRVESSAEKLSAKRGPDGRLPDGRLVEGRLAYERPSDEAEGGESRRGDAGTAARQRPAKHADEGESASDDVGAVDVDHQAQQPAPGRVPSSFRARQSDAAADRSSAAGRSAATAGRPWGQSHGGPAERELLHGRDSRRDRGSDDGDLMKEMYEVYSTSVREGVRECVVVTHPPTEPLLGGRGHAACSAGFYGPPPHLNSAANSAPVGSVGLGPGSTGPVAAERCTAGSGAAVEDTVDAEVRSQMLEPQSPLIIYSPMNEPHELNTIDPTQGNLRVHRTELPAPITGLYAQTRTFWTQIEPGNVCSPPTQILVLPESRDVPPVNVNVRAGLATGSAAGARERRGPEENLRADNSGKPRSGKAAPGHAPLGPIPFSGPSGNVFSSAASGTAPSGSAPSGNAASGKSKKKKKPKAEANSGCGVQAGGIVVEQPVASEGRRGQLVATESGSGEETLEGAQLSSERTSISSGDRMKAPSRVRSRKGILVVSSHRNLRLFDLWDMTGLVTLAVAPSSYRPSVALDSNYLWYESANTPTELICYDWLKLRRVRRFFVDFDVALEHLVVTSTSFNVAKAAAAPTTVFSRWPSSGFHAALRNRSTAAPTQQAAPTNNMWLDCGSTMSPRMTTDDDLGCFACDSSFDESEEPRRQQTTRCRLGAIHSCEAGRYLLLIDSNCRLVCVYEVAGNAGSRARHRAPISLDADATPSVDLRLVTGAYLARSALNANHLLKRYWWKRWDQKRTETCDSDDENEAQVCASVTLKYLPALENFILALATNSGYIHIFTHALSGPTPLLKKLFSFHLGSPNVPENFAPSLQFSGDGSSLLVASLNGFMHTIPMTESTIMSQNNNSLPNSWTRNRSSILELPERIFRSSSVSGESTRVCRQRHHHRDRAWTEAPSDNASIGGGLMKQIRLIR